MRLWPGVWKPSLQLRAQKADDVVGRNHAHQFALIVNYGEAEQVVLIEEFSHLVFFGIGMAGNQRFLYKRQQRFLALRQHQPGQGYRAYQDSFAVDQEQRTYGFDPAFMVSQSVDG